jgi:hypothetical protein
MIKVSRYLIENYFKKLPYFKDKTIPDVSELTLLLKSYKDNLIVLVKGQEIIGVALFMRLEDKSYDNIETIDMFNEHVMHSIMNEKGRHIHFILAVGSGYRLIRHGIKVLKEEFNPISFSWWSPDRKRIHRYNLNKEEKCIMCQL